ncbi:hypothetical protein G7Y89_g6708 [Cudoniella acicularis]|uniref:Protein kinase domain-containing protein n=1 Tax=Cudoniella acicularis TaxID=354080 RepID=A0A8H4W2R7_9HELO|nr:hypothetical protein G7Y89_g6708 [Cudoniella acicularis]
MDSIQSFASSVNGVEQYYPQVSDEAEALHPPKQANVAIGQSAFLNLLGRLNLPVLGRSRNRDAQDVVFVGQGTSFVVTQALVILTRKQGFLNERESDTSKLGEALQPKAFVTKRIVPKPSQAVEDSRQLAAITNEVRVLANESVRNAKCIVRLLGVAWDEVPTAGRYWPRLLLEAADYGALGDFLANSSDARMWYVRMELLLDVLDGLKSLHFGGISHCDLKLENTLVFRGNGAEHDDSSSFKYRAKLCDFGFAIIQGDYEERSSFSVRLGTEPWNAPELMGETEARTADLPKADIYSFGLLFSRVVLQGGNPFGELNAEEIRELKERDDDNGIELTTIENVMLSLCSAEEFSDSEVDTISLVLQYTLAHRPDDRRPIHTIAYLLLYLESLRQRTNRPFKVDSSGIMQEEIALPGEPISRPQMQGISLAGMFRFINSAVSLLYAPLAWIFLKIRSTFNLLFGPTLAALQVMSNMKKITGKRVELLTELAYSPRNSSPAQEYDATSDLPRILEFEVSRDFNPVELPDSVAKELHRDLLQQANSSSQDDESSAPEASYQLAVAHFEGIGVARDLNQSINWLKRAIGLGSRKALSAVANLLVSFGRPVPKDLETAIRGELSNYAKEDLHVSLFESVQNSQQTLEIFPSLRLWSRQDPTGYEQYLDSSFLNEMKTVTLSACLVLGGPQSDYEPFDFQVLEGYDGRGDPHFDISKKDQFIASVRKQECTESIGDSRLTLLQIAALMGDVKMAEALVIDLGADVNAIGDTPGYSPLWITCLNGHLNMALFLIKHGADVRVKDAKDGWDFSHGAAAQVLLRARANPLVHSKMNFRAAVGALRTLDVDLLASIFEQAGKRHLEDNENKRMSISPLEQEKALAFNFLFHQTEFYCRRVCGSDTDIKLKSVADLILQENMSSTFRSMGLMEGDSTPLIISCYRGRIDLLKVILSSAACPDLDAVDSCGMTAIHWCAERGNLDGAKELLCAGANPLLFENKGFNVFHIAARFAPDFLMRILDAIESGEVPRPQGLDARALLAISAQNEDEAPPFVLLVLEGTPEHLRSAEMLRKQYCLDYDAYEIPTLRLFHHREYEAKMTLMAYLTAGSVVTNIITLSQVEYVLNLEPKPRFRADTSGKTLLHFAVSGFYHADLGSNSSGYAVLQLLLRTFSGRSYVETPDDEGNTPIHSAAAASNLTALEIIESHLASQSEDFNVNVRNNEGETPLDLLGRMGPVVLNMSNEYMSKIFKERTEATRAFLRRLSAYKSSEIELLERGRLPLEEIITGVDEVGIDEALR